jgi:hypothetical protein
VLAVDAAGFDTLHASGGVAVPAGSPGAWRVTIPPYASAAWRLR